MSAARSQAGPVRVPRALVRRALAECLLNGLLGGADLVKRGNLRMRAQVSGGRDRLPPRVLCIEPYMERWGP